MKTIEQTRRELFEADFKVRRKSTFPAIELSRDSGSGYKYNPAHSDWMAFNAALDSVLIELPGSHEAMKSVFDYQHGPSNKNVTGTTNWAANLGMVVVDDCRASIESTNLGLKIR